jgi:hypothetical protein
VGTSDGFERRSKADQARALFLICPLCGAAPGDRCADQSGKPCMVHNERYPARRRSVKVDPPAKPVQRELFPLLNDAQREGGL